MPEPTTPTPTGVQEVRGFKVTCGACREDYDDPEGYTTLFDTAELAIQRVEGMGWAVFQGRVICRGCLEEVGVDA